MWVKREDYEELERRAKQYSELARNYNAELRSERRAREEGISRVAADVIEVLGVTDAYSNAKREVQVDKFLADLTLAREHLEQTGKWVRAEELLQRLGNSAGSTRE